MSADHTKPDDRMQLMRLKSAAPQRRANMSATKNETGTAQTNAIQNIVPRLYCEYTSQIIHKPIISAKIAACKSNILASELPVLRLYRQENAPLPTILPSNKGEDELPRSEQYNESVK